MLRKAFALKLKAFRIFAFESIFSQALSMPMMSNHDEMMDVEGERNMWHVRQGFQNVEAERNERCRLSAVKLRRRPVPILGRNSVVLISDRRASLRAYKLIVTCQRGKCRVTRKMIPQAALGCTRN